MATTMTPPAPRPAAVAVVRYEGFHCRIPAAVAYAELEKIRAATGTDVCPRDVVRAARRKNNPLHTAFLWNDKKAAQKHREATARKLIAAIRVVPIDSPAAAPRPAYVHVRAAGPPAQGYRLLATLTTDAPAAASVIADAVTQLRGWRRRYDHLVGALGDVFAAIDAALDALPPPPA